MGISSTISVLTGDLINSTSLGSHVISDAMLTLTDAAKTVERWTGAPVHFTRHRGDGWQVALRSPKYGLRAAIYFRAALKANNPGCDSAIGIAEGEINDPISSDLNTETGAPFVASGRLLETSHLFDVSKRALAIAKRSRPHMNHARGGAFEATVILTDRICREWTGPQAEAMLHALHPDQGPDYTEIGHILGKSRQAVTKALDAAWHDELSLALIMLESTYHD